jgi:hypothetical protein
VATEPPLHVGARGVSEVISVEVSRPERRFDGREPRLWPVQTLAATDARVDARSRSDAEGWAGARRDA